MANIKDVAEKAGVTVTTVSRVLNDRGYISENTRKKVFDAIAQLDYHPNDLARALFRQKSNMIGLIIPSAAHPFYAELVNSVEYYAYNSGYKILVCNSYYNSEKEKDYISMLKRNQVDGIIMGSHTLDVSEYLNLSLPIVAIDRFLSDSIPYIASDNYNGGVLATKLLIEKGCRHLAHISGPLFLNTPANKRYDAFVEVAKENNVPIEVCETGLNSFEGKEHEKLIFHLLQEHPDIDGIFASSDMVAASVIDVCNLIGKHVPNDIKVVGYDDIYLASMFIPSITTIHQPIKKMGQLAIDIINRQCEKESVSMENILPVELIERKSA